MEALPGHTTESAVVLPWMGQRDKHREADKKVTTGQVLQDKFPRQENSRSTISPSKCGGSEIAGRVSRELGQQF